MDAFYHCLIAALNECQKTGVALTKDIGKVDCNIDMNFDLPVNRITFLYKFGTFNIHFFKKCFLDFALNCSEVSIDLERILSSKLVCSLNNGPGTDIIGLQFAFKEIGKTFSPKTIFKIINKYGAWRNTMNSLIESKGNVIPIVGNFKLLQCNIIEFLSSKAENCLKSADVVLMDHAFSSPNAQRVNILEVLKIILRILKPGAYVLFIDTNNKVFYFELLNSFGTYIYGPKLVQVDDLPYNEIIAQQIGEKPVLSGKAYYGIWQKNTPQNMMADGVSDFVNVIQAMGEKEKGTSLENMSAKSSPVIVQPENKTSDHPLLVNVMPVVQNLGESVSFKSATASQRDTPLVNLIPAMQNLSASGILMRPGYESERKSAICSFASETNCTVSQYGDIITEQNKADTETDCTEDLKTLLFSLNCLVSKLENFLSSEINSKNPNSIKCSIHKPTCRCCNQCFNCYHCCINKKPCFQCCGHGLNKNVPPNTNQSCNCHALSDA